MFVKTDFGRWFHHEERGVVASIFVFKLRDRPELWCARVSFSEWQKDVELAGNTADEAARRGVSDLDRRLTGRERINILGRFRNDPDWPLTMASHDDLKRAMVVSESEAAHRLSLSPSSLRRMREAGEGPRAVWLSERRLGYLVSELEEWLETRPAAL